MKNYNTLLCASALLALTACGGGGGSSSNDTPTPEPVNNTGVFLDSPVINIGYRTETLEGVTDAQGVYEYVTGETVTFFIGDLVFPSVTATGTITPLDLAGTDDVNDPTVVNMIRLLQTLDSNGDPSDGVTITDEAAGIATAVVFDSTVAEFESSDAVTSLIRNPNLNLETSVVELVSAVDAAAHFEGELSDSGILYGSLQAVWELPNESVIFMYLPDGRYFAIQWEEENNFIGFERGTYTESGADISFTTLQNNDGEALVCNEPSNSTCSNEVFGFSISSNELTLNPSDEGSVAFGRLF